MPGNDAQCGACKTTLKEEDAQVCWFDLKPLCFPCWDAVGHCGHPEADRVNNRGELHHLAFGLMEFGLRFRGRNA